jgi:GntR family transcriptional regulator
MPADPASRRPGAARQRGRVPAPREATQTRVEQVARAIAGDILDGRRQIGSDLPGEAEIAAAQDCRVGTARAALRQLEALGLIARQRDGTARIIAADIRASYAVTARMDGPAGAYLAPTRLLIERQRQVSGDLELALLLGTPEAATWLRFSGLRMAADAAFGPLSCVDVWLATRTPTLDLPDEITPASLERLLGVAIVEIEEEIVAGALTPAQARYLRARGGTPCLSLLRRYRRRGGAVVAALRDVHPADRAGVLLRLRRD